MTTFEKKIAEGLKACDTFIDAIDYLYENDYQSCGYCEEANEPAKLELYFEYGGDEEVSGDGTFDLYLFTTEDVYEMYENEETDEDGMTEYDYFIGEFICRDWYEIENYIYDFVPNIYRVEEPDSDIDGFAYLGVSREVYNDMMAGYDNWKKNR